MFLAVSFDICRVIGIDKMVTMAVVVRIVVREASVGVVICDIAKAAPVRDFWNRISVTKEVVITIVLIEPRRIRNCSRVVLPKISEAMIAA